MASGKDKAYEHTGVYQVVDPPARLVFTWISAGTDHQATLVSVEPVEQPGGTELVLTHERFPSSEARDRHQHGWGQIADKLAGFFARSK